MKNAALLLKALRTIHEQDKNNMSVIIKKANGNKADDIFVDNRTVADFLKSTSFVTDFTKYILDALKLSEAGQIYFGTSDQIDQNSSLFVAGCKRDFVALRKTGKAIYIIVT